MGLESEIRYPEKTYSGSRIQGSKRHRIPDPDPQHWWDPGYEIHIETKKKALNELWVISLPNQRWHLKTSHNLFYGYCSKLKSNDSTSFPFSFQLFIFFKRALNHNSFVRGPHYNSMGYTNIYASTLCFDEQIVDMQYSRFRIRFFSSGFIASWEVPTTFQWDIRIFKYFNALFWRTNCWYAVF